MSAEPLPWGVLLAAGSGRRFQVQAVAQQAPGDRAGADERAHDKLLQVLPDGRFIAVAAAQALRAVLPRVVAVVRPGADALAEALVACGAQVIVVPQPPEPAEPWGMGDSLALAVRASAEARHGWLVALADMPQIAPATIRRLAAAVVQGGPQALVAPSHQGRRGHPVGFGAAHGAALSGLKGDVGARALLQVQASRLTLIEVDDAGVLADVDTPADLTRLTTASRQP